MALERYNEGLDSVARLRKPIALLEIDPQLVWHSKLP
jgi:hypothetical protein